MSENILVEIKPESLLEIICLMNVLDFISPAKERMEKLQENLQKQLAEKCTVEQLEIALDEMSGFIDPEHFHEFVEVNL